MSLFVVTSHLHLFQVPDQYGTIRAVAEGRAEQFLVGTSRNFILRGTFNDGFQIEVQVSCGMPTFSSLFLDNMLWFLQGGFFVFRVIQMNSGALQHIPSKICSWRVLRTGRCACGTQWSTGWSGPGLWTWVQSFPVQTPPSGARWSIHLTYACSLVGGSRVRHLSGLLPVWIHTQKQELDAFLSVSVVNLQRLCTFVEH